MAKYAVIKYVSRGLLLAALIAGAWTTLLPPPAEASTFGRDLEYGYYDGKRYSKSAPDYYWYSYMFESGLPSSWETTRTTADIFIDDVRAKLNGPSVIDNARASVLVNVMMGIQAQDSRYDGPKPQRYQNGIDVARAQFDRWAGIVREYDRCSRTGNGNGNGNGACRYPGASVNFNEIYPLDDTINGYGVGETGGDPQIADVVFAPIGGSSEDMIVFRHANGTTFTIKKKCGNLTGDQSSFPDSPPAGELNPPTGGGGVPPGYNPGDSTSADPSAATTSSCLKVTGWARDPNDASYRVPVTIRYTISGQPPITMPAVNASNVSPFAFGQDTPAAVRNSTQPVQVSAVGRALDGSSFALDNSFTMGPCRIVTAACNGILVNPVSIDPGSRYTITARINYGNAADAASVLAQPGGARFFINIQGPGVNTTLPNVPIVNSGNGILSATTPEQIAGQTGTYTVSYGIVAATGAITCSGSGPVNPGGEFPVTSKPYFQVNYGDVSAGSGMSVGGTDCAVARNDRAGIVSWNRGAAGNYGGAGTAFSALALGRLQDFATAQGDGLAPDGAAFANNADGQVNASAGLFGGGFGGIDCTSDYFEGVDPADIQNGNVTIGPQTIPNCDGTNDTACKQVIYVRGNVYITGNIVFSGGSSGYAGLAAIPSYSIVVTGNIYIAPGVTQLDGFYIAQPTNAAATNGVIYTCAPAPFTSAALDRNLLANCGTALTVNGSFIGRQVWLLRASGSVSGAPAETFNYSPELWLSAPFGNGLTESNGNYDAITSLPPVL